MTCNNVFLTQPQAESSVNYTIPEGDSARLNFGPEDMTGIRLNDSGGLVISFDDGGHLTITNFEQLANSGSLMYLADGSLIDPSILTTTLQAPNILKTNDVVSLETTINTILPPGENSKQEINLSAGQKYICNFDPTNTATIEIIDGKMILTFADGSQVIFNNYEEMMAGELPPELTLADGTVIETEELLTEVLDIDDLANIETAAGEDETEEMDEDELAALAEELANVMPAAGEGAGGASNSGYGFNSSPIDVLLDSPDALGPLNPTRLEYNAPTTFADNTAAQRDDRPIVGFENVILDETDLSNGNLVATGTLSVNYGNDFPGKITSNGNYFVNGSVNTGTLLSNSVPVVISRTSTGYEGTADGTVVFTFVMNPNTGSYTYTQLTPLDHADTTNNNDVININLGFNATDADGDVSSTVIRISIADDAPIVMSQIDKTIDESFSEIQFGGHGTVEGQFYADVGQDVSELPYSANGNFETGGSVANNVLSSNGIIIEVTLTSTGYIGTANGITAFTVTIDPATGEYTYKQFLPLDHADGNDANDVIQLQFGVDVTDYDGDVASGFITINVVDDAPEINDSTGRVDEEKLAGGTIIIAGTLDPDFNADGSGEIATTGNFEVNGTNVLSHNGVAIIVTSTPTGYVGMAGSVTVFTLDINVTTGEYTYNQIKNLDHTDRDQITLTFEVGITDFDGDTDTANIIVDIIDSNPEFQTGEPQPDNGLETVDESDNGPLVETGKLTADFGADSLGTYQGNPNKTPAGLTHCGENVTVTFDSSANTFTGSINNGTTIFTLVINKETGDYTYAQFLALDHSDTTDANDLLRLEFGVDAVDGDGDAAEGSIIINVLDDGPQAENDYTSIREGITLDGNVLNNDNAGADGLDTITQVTVNDVTTQMPANGLLILQGNYGTLTLQANGNYIYTPNNDDPDGTDYFTYTIRDCDGDLDRATLTIEVSPDYVPIAIHGSGETDDTNVANFGHDAEVGTINVDYRGEGPGTTSGNGDFEVVNNANLANGTLTSNGLPVTVTFDANKNTYTGTTNTAVIFTMEIKSDNSYSFTQYQNFDHGNNTESNNEAITLLFGVNATDKDGDTGTGTVTINVHDDGPNAVNDTGIVERKSQTASGNVLTNDNAGADDGIILKVLNPGTYQGDFGTLVLQANGTYTFTRNGNNAGTDTFKYTIMDGDGDTATALLNITVYKDFSPINISGSGETDDSNVVGAQSDVETGVINVNTQGDGFGSTSGNGNFSSGGSQLGGQLTHNGNAIQVTFDSNANTYVGKAGNETIFTMQINTNGTYRFVQYESFDHGTVGNNNEAISLNFGVNATDSDGDAGSGTVTIIVRDDGPTARNDSLSVTNSSGTGNVLANDNSGADGGAIVTRFNVGGRWYNIGETAVTSIGNVTMASNGVYTVNGRPGPTSSTSTTSTTSTTADWRSEITTVTTTTTTTNTVAGGTINVTYEIRDGDGDTATANLGVNLVPIVTTSSSVGTQQWVTNTWWGGDGSGDGAGDGGGSSPLVLDLDRDGIEMTTIQDGVRFDIGSDGDLDQVAWVSADDGLLAIDRNNDGLINDHSELFGTLEVDGFTHLSQYDSNNDGKIDANDQIFSDLRVWQDLNQDGVTQEGELRTLQDLGITSINLAATMTDYYLEGSWVAYNSSFTYEDGTEGTIADVWFSYIDEAVWNNLVSVMGEEAANEWLSNAYSTVTEFIPSEVNENWQPGDPLVLGSTHKVFETGNGSVVSQEGELTVFYNGDNPGEINGNGQFHYGGSLLNGALTSKGQDISVVFDADTGIYHGSAGDVMVFNLQVNTDGSYNFNLFEGIDHGNNVNFDDNILLQFGVTVTDADGDSADSAIRIQVRDSGSYLSGDIDGNQDIDNFGPEDVTFFQAISEASSTIMAFGEENGPDLDISQMLETADDVTMSIQEFVHSNIAEESISDIEDIPTAVDLTENIIPELIGDNGSII